MRRAIGWCAAAALATAGYAPVRAQEPAAAPALSGVVAPAGLADGKLRAGLADAVRMAIENNLDVDLLRIDPLVAESQLGSAWGAYDPELFASTNLSDSDTPNANIILGQDTVFGFFHQRIWDTESGLRGLVPWIGGSYSAAFSRTETESNSSVALLSPQFGATVLASAQIPLLRGLFWSEPWTAVRLARIDVDATRDSFEAELMDVVSRTENAYWLLVSGRDATRVARKSLETAGALLDQTKAQYEVGVVSKVEVVQAEAGVADREFRRIEAEALERNAQDAFVDAVLGPYLAPRTEIQVELLDLPEERSVTEVDAQAAAERAFANRPELEAARSAIEQREVQLKFASNQRLPQLDVVGSYGKSDLSGRCSDAFGFSGINCNQLFGGDPPRPIPPPSSGWSAAYDDLFSANGGRQFTVGGVLSIPLGNVRARSDYDRARLELRRAQTALRRLEQSIVSDIRRAARNLLAAIEGIEAAERAVAAADEQLRAERVRLEYGESTPFDVLLREDDLVQAEAQRIFAQKAYHDAITALDRAQGTILSRNGIRVEEAAALR